MSVDNKISDTELQEINKFTRQQLKADDIYTFKVTLCDNEIDRDIERFTTEALYRLKELFVGKTGIFDHNPSGKNQTARIYETQIIKDNTKKTQTGEAYTYLAAKAYMVRTEKNRDLIKEIEAGIKKEVSVSCSVADTRCSICGRQIKEGCSHIKGKKYNDKICHYILDNPTDAYEWSFVAVPAQKNAGVTKNYNINQGDNVKNITEILKDVAYSSEKEKSFSFSSEEIKSLSLYIDELKQAASDGEKYKEDLQKDVIRLSFLAQESINPQIFKGIVEKMDIDELKEFKKAYESRCEEDNINTASKALCNSLNQTQENFKI